MVVVLVFLQSEGLNGIAVFAQLGHGLQVHFRSIAIHTAADAIVHVDRRAVFAAADENDSRLNRLCRLLRRNGQNFAVRHIGIHHLVTGVRFSHKSLRIGDVHLAFVVQCDLFSISSGVPVSLKVSSRLVDHNRLLGENAHRPNKQHC